MTAKLPDLLRDALDEAFRLWLAGEPFPARGDGAARERLVDLCVDRFEAAQRVQFAKRRAASEAKGARWGRQPRMTEAEVECALAMRANGRPARAIARDMKIPRTTLARALARAASATVGS